MRERWSSLAVRGAALVFLGLALAAGCAGQSQSNADPDLCPGVCEKGKKCPMAPPVGSCDDECLGEDYVAEQSGCHDVYLKSVDCLSKLADVCTGQTACVGPLKVVYDCEHAYCAAHASDQACVNVK